MFTLNDLFDIAVKMEKNGKNIYINAMSETGNRELKALLQWMADEEGGHSSWFASQKSALPRAGDDLEVMLPDVLNEMMGDNSLSLDEVDFSTITTKKQMLSTFIMFEKDTIMFYEFLENFIEEPTVKTGLQNIIREETAHVKKLSAMMESIED